MDQIAPILTALAALLGAGGLYAILRVRAENRKSDAQTKIALSDSVLSSYDGLLADLQEEVKRTRNDYRDEITRIKEDSYAARLAEKECQRRLSAAERKIYSLESQVGRIQANLP